MVKSIVVLGMINALTGVGYSLIAPLYPLLAIEKNIKEDIIGVIISIFAVSTIICSPFIPNIINRYGKRTILENSIMIQVTIS
jgi:predicted MFS family arabinose efflux permease